MPIRTRKATTVALLTPRGEGGISVIQLAGPDTAAILERVFRPKGRQARKSGDSIPGMRLNMRAHRPMLSPDFLPRRLHYGAVVDGAGDLLDEVIIRAGPDRAEINCHGGVVVTRRVMDRLVELGAVAVESQPPSAPDAVAVEALNALPLAHTGLAAAMLLDQYHGALSRAVLELVGDLEAGRAEEAVRGMGRLIGTARLGLRLTEPPRVVIAGRPNVGKSSLLNALAGQARVLVHEVAGTTRDYVDTVAVIGGLAVRLCDTAGIGRPADAIEEAAMQRAVEQAAAADLVVALLDASEPLTEADRALAAQLRGRAGVPQLGQRPVLPVVNKVDLPVAISQDAVADLVGKQPLLVSALSGQGVNALGRRIVEEVFGPMPEPGAAVVFTPRQRDLIESALSTPENAAPILRNIVSDSLT